MSSRERLRLVLVLCFLIALGPLTIDMYLPALPTITGDLHTTAAAVQLTLTGTLAGLALGQLLIGPLSDALGRRAPLLAGIAVHIFASILCVIAPNLAVLGTLRALQGLGGITLSWTSWRGVFVVLALFGIAIITVTALALPETLPAERRRSGGVLGTIRDYGRLFTDRVYLGLILVAGLAMAALFAYVSGSSFVKAGKVQSFA